RTDRRGQSAFAPENFTTLAHFSVSEAMSFPNSAGVIGIPSPPSSASRTLSFGPAGAAFDAPLRPVTISGGRPLGATVPYPTPPRNRVPFGLSSAHPELPPRACPPSRRARAGRQP